MKIAAIQHDIAWCDRQANFNHLAMLIAQAELNGAKLVLLAETFSTGFSVQEEDFAEPQGGPSCAFLYTLSLHDALPTIGRAS